MDKHGIRAGEGTITLAVFLWRHRALVFWGHLALALLPAAVAALLAPALIRSAWFWVAVGALACVRALAWIAAWARPHAIPAPLALVRRALLRTGMPVAAVVDGRIEFGEYVAPGRPGYHELQLPGARVALPESEIYPLPGPRRPRRTGDADEA